MKDAMNPQGALLKTLKQDLIQGPFVVVLQIRADASSPQLADDGKSRR